MKPIEHVQLPRRRSRRIPARAADGTATNERRPELVDAAQRRYLDRLMARYIAYFIPKGAKVVEIAPRTGPLNHWLASIEWAVYRPGEGVRCGSAEVLNDLEGLIRFSPDWIVLDGCRQSEREMDELHRACRSSTRAIIIFYNSLWRPVLRCAAALGIQAAEPVRWLMGSRLANLARFEIVTNQPRVLLPIWIPLVSDLVNRWLAPLPVLRRFALLHVAVARVRKPPPSGAPPSVSIVVPARNESGNVDELIRRIPRMGPRDELILVEGHSTDDTWTVIRAAAARHPARDIRCLRQPGTGKGDAVRAGLAVAKREIVMVLDADLSVAPEDLIGFYRARVSGAGELVIGSRFVFDMNRRAMRLANRLGNKLFARAFSLFLGQRFTDTLCGAKVIDRDSFLRLSAARGDFGDFDPFGDFDLIFGAHRLGLKIVELPVRYHERTYGTTNIDRWRDGWRLLRMTVVAVRRIVFR